MPRRSTAFGIFLLGLLLAIPAAAKTGFESCLSRLRQQALAEGISHEAVRTALAGTSFSQRVIELDRRQPEFTATFADYLGRRVTQERVDRGRALLDRHRDLLDRVARRYGVPAHYLVAFWGMETDYGRHFGTMPVLDSLATLACDTRRSEYFTGELLAALRIVDSGDIGPDRMQGSWAGAMGHFQFMPSAFLRHAVDADGDGRRNLWHSIADAAASAGNFLHSLGWDPDSPWGREVRLPDGFPYHLGGLHRARGLREWHRLGVRRADGGPLPDTDLEGALLVPAGHRGPAFLVHHNFRVMMDWNRSRFYALAVGHLADRIAGAGGLHRPVPPDIPDLSRGTVESLQTTLAELGYDSGPVDGIVGPATRDAIRAFQQDRGMVADGFPGRVVLEALGDRR